MLAHQGGDASALRLPRNDVPAIADMGTKAGLIGLDEVGPDNPSTGLVKWRAGWARPLPSPILGTDGCGGQVIRERRSSGHWSFSPDDCDAMGRAPFPQGLVKCRLFKLVPLVEQADRGEKIFESAIGSLAMKYRFHFVVPIRQR